MRIFLASVAVRKHTFFAACFLVGQSIVLKRVIMRYLIEFHFSPTYTVQKFVIVPDASNIATLRRAIAKRFDVDDLTLVITYFRPNDPTGKHHGLVFLIFC